jgi:hypothetical protein
MLHIEASVASTLASVQMKVDLLFAVHSLKPCGLFIL